MIDCSAKWITIHTTGATSCEVLRKTWENNTLHTQVILSMTVCKGQSVETFAKRVASVENLFFTPENQNVLVLDTKQRNYSVLEVPPVGPSRVVSSGVTREDAVLNVRIQRSILPVITNQTIFFSNSDMRNSAKKHLR